MSYILDALKKADAERERRGVPSLSAQSATIADDDRRGGRGAGLAIVAVLVVLALGAWWSFGRDNTASPAPVVATAPAPAPAPNVTTIAPPAPAKVIAVAPPPVIVPPAPAVRAPAPAVASTARPSAATDRLPTLNELSADQRRQLPPLAVSGAVYSPQASGRMLFINGQVLREGDKVADGLVVERIGAKSSVLSLRGSKFELKH